jgi:polysaccharide biosynthesis protein VpsM
MEREIRMKRVLLLSALAVLIPSVVWAGNPIFDNVSVHSEGAILKAAVTADADVAKPVLVAQAMPADPSAGAPASSTPSQGVSQPAAAAEAPPMGQASGGAGEGELSGDVLERKSNIVHPFLAVGGYFTDNVYNSHDHRKSDFGMVVSPGIYFAVPGLRQRITPVSTLNIAPGGANMTGFRPDSPRTLQTYLYYRADIEAFANESSLNSVSHLAEGMVQYNMRGGLQLQFEDQFTQSHNQRGTGFSFGLDKFYANMAALSAKYQISEKTMLRLDLSNYYLHFLASENGFRDRNDYRASAYAFYKLWPRTAIFVQYEYIDTQYREDIVSGSMEHHAFVGVKHDITDKTRGMLKVGYGIKEFERGSIGAKSNVYAEAQLDHKFTEKTSVILKAIRRTDEPDVAQANSIVETTGDVTFLHRLTTKLTANVGVRFTDEKYNGTVTYGGETKALHDQYLRAGASLLYEFRDWLSFTLGYYFTDRMSNIGSLSYTNNTVFFRISAIY